MILHGYWLRTNSRFLLHSLALGKAIEFAFSPEIMH